MTATTFRPAGTIVRTGPTATGSAPVVTTPVGVVDDPKASAFIAVVWTFIFAGLVSALIGTVAAFTTDSVGPAMTLLCGGIALMALSAATFRIVDQSVRARTGMRL